MKLYTFYFRFGRPRTKGGGEVGLHLPAWGDTPQEAIRWAWEVASLPALHEPGRTIVGPGVEPPGYGLEADA